MKIIRKATALLMTAFIVIRVLIFNTFAISSAPIALSGELADILINVLLNTGIFSAEVLADKSCEDLKQDLKELMSSDTLPTDSPNVFANLENSFFNFITSPASTVTGSLVQSTAKQAIDDWVVKSMSSMIDHVIPTPAVGGNAVDMHGNGAMVEIRRGSYVLRWWAEYITYYSDQNCTLHGMGASTSGNVSEIDSNTPSRRNVDGLSFYTISGSSSFGEITSVKYYGDVRTSDGTDVDTGEEKLPIIGKIDDKAITPDILNPDGTVTIDGVTYYPSDYLDRTKFDDTAILDLLNEIREAIDNLPVVDEDNAADDLVGDVSVDLDIGELNNFEMPAGIANVFPFCLPFDFVRGIKGLVARPQIPVFKTELDLTNFCGYDLGKHTIKISLEKWEPAVVVFRWFSLILFSFSLILLTGKIVKGAGA